MPGVILFVLVYYALPLPIQLIVMPINFVTPDPVSIADEAFMVTGFIGKLKSVSTAMDIMEWIEDHPILSKIIIAFIVLLIIFLIINILN